MRHTISGLVCALACSLLPPMAAAETDRPDMEALCATIACREGGFEAMIAIDAVKHTYIGVPVNRSPYVTPEGSILIFPGEALLFQFDGDSETPGTPKFVRAYAARYPAQIDIDGRLDDNPENASLPPVPEKGGTIDYAALPPNSLYLDYGQAVDGKKTMMMLVVDGSFTKMLKFDATMYVPQPGEGGYDEAYTSTCPVHPQSGVFEFWPHPIGPIFLDNFRFVSADETTCK